MTLPGSGTSATAPTSASQLQLDEAIQREIDAKVAQAKKELQEEMRAQSATQAASQPGWEDATVTSRTKLQLFVAHGYFRVRPELFNYFDLNQPPFNGYWLFPVPDGGDPIINPGGHTTLGVNMRFRLEPTINVSEDLRIKAQIDMLDNLVWGSTPAYAYTRYQGVDVAILNNANQVAPVAGVNAALGNIDVKRVWGEVSTPVGLLKFGRMGTNFGLGINYNDGTCLDCDFESNMDAFQFIAEPLPGFFVIPIVSFDVTGLLNARTLDNAEQVDVTTSDNATTWRIQLARLDTDQQQKAKIGSGGAVFNYGFDFAYRTMKYEFLQYGDYTQLDPYSSPSPSLGNRVARFGNLSIPDIWLKFENRAFRIEFEGVSYLGEFNAPILPGGQTINVTVVQFGAAGEAEYKILNGAVGIGFKGGFASGDSAPGFGVRVTRPSKVSNGSTASVAPGAPTNPAQPGDIDGAQYGRQFQCYRGLQSRTCTDNDIRNYKFNPDYHIDQILWRYILGTITDAWYIRPSVYWNIFDGLQLAGNVVYSQAIYTSSTPSAYGLPNQQNPPNVGSPALGLEIDAGIKYETEDGLFAQLYYGILIPFAGLQNNSLVIAQGLHVAQSLRAMIGIRF
jgi:uncharacterized protein (TIGR04551 family)